MLACPSSQSQRQKKLFRKSSRYLNGYLREPLSAQWLKARRLLIYSWFNRPGYCKTHMRNEEEGC